MKYELQKNACQGLNLNCIVIHELFVCTELPNDECQVFDSYVHSSSYALLTFTELPNNELTGIHTLSLPHLLL